ncbi:MAG: CopD family protein [Chloroflexota bacterium]
MPSIPFWALGLVYWLHMLATVAWIGSLVAISLLFLPAIRKTLKPFDQLAVLAAMQKRLEPIAWFSMVLLAATGLFQLSANPHYDGFLSTSGQWSIAILVKHSLSVVMVVVSAIQTWEVLPAIHRGLLRAEKADPEELARLQRQETLLLRINLFLSALILAATALARAS